MNEVRRRHPFLEKKGFRVVQEELKQRIISKADTIKRYKKRCTRFKENRMFESNERCFYRNLNEEDKDNMGETNKEENPDGEACTKFWSDIWSNPAEHNAEAEWIQEINEQFKNIETQEELNIDHPKMKERIGKTANWKAPGPDGVHGYWIKKRTSLHPRITCQLNTCMKSGIIPQWMTSGRTFLLLKDPTKGPVPSNYQ